MSGTPTAGAEQPKADKNRYRSTLNLPRTAFAMKANLVQNEPQSLKRWAELYGRLREARAGRERFVFHDGPPYANGSIHMGHLLNKCLKDFVVRTRSMMGMDCPFVPGWDCHGLPIEHKVMMELVEAGKMGKLKALEEDARRMAVRRECQKYAAKFHKLHTEQMTRLLTLADYEHPYLTMQPQYEAATLGVLAELLEQGLVYRALKAVHWSVANETALAEAELEYEDREDVSVYVDFEAEDAGAVYDAFGLSDDGRDARTTGDFTAEGTEVGAGESGGGGAGRPSVRPSFMIWTTTPWTLPANVVLAVNPKLTYALVRMDGSVTVVAEGLVEKVAKLGGAERVEVLATAPGERLLGLRYRHPFVEAVPEMAGQEHVGKEKVWSVVGADYVTLEDGTGLVHTATGHGHEDYQTGIREGIPVYCPVKADGTYDQTAPQWLRGKDVWEANTLVTERLRGSGHLFHSHTFVHSYPHDWRSKTPVIFRATEQWFVAVDQPAKEGGLSLRRMALAAVGASGKDGRPETRSQRRIHKHVAELEHEAREESPEAETTESARPRDSEASNSGFSASVETLFRLTGTIEFVPKWGRDRMRGMLESRPDWCISRQRAWGLPIPAFFTPEGEALMTPASVRAVAAVVGEKGSDAWFTLPPEELLRGYDPASDPDAPQGARGVALKDLAKGRDIFDVWFESGSSWHAVMRQRGLGFPVDLYLEGSDQHRGWFQLSLLPALGVTGRPPFRAILTHGFMVDKDGRKLSKSAGDTVEDLFRDYGVDVLRWWVCSLSYENDCKVDREFFDLAGESYRKVRNTLRFMLGNLDDFDPGTHGEMSFEPSSPDAWVLAELDKLAATVVRAYENYDFRTAHLALYDFCNETLSAVYLAAVKDRLYCDRPGSPRRRRTQAALWTLTDGLCRLLAPVLCHTADEAFRALRKADEDACVHLEEFPSPTGVRAGASWGVFFKVRERALAALERAKAELGVENPLDAGVELPAGELAGLDPVDMADLLGVSRVSLDPAAGEVRVQDLRDQPRCERSWKRDGTVRRRADGGMLSDRDAEAVGVE